MILSKLSEPSFGRTLAGKFSIAVLVALTAVGATASVPRHNARPAADGATSHAAAAGPPSAPPAPAKAPTATEAATPTAESAPPTAVAPETPTPVETAPAAAEPEPVDTAAVEAPARPAPAAGPSAAPVPPAPEPTPAPALVESPLPLDYGGGAGQVVTVAAPSWGATTATVTAWNRNDDGSWSAAVGPVPARIGSQGIGQASESLSRTPAGVYSLTQAFGRQGNPGTALPYFQTGPSDWWDENPDSPTYNQHVVQDGSPGGASENLYTSGSVYDYAILIDYNTAGVPGAGSAFFLHVTNGAATAGCVAIDAGSLVAILQWIGPGAVIVLGVG